MVVISKSMFGLKNEEILKQFSTYLEKPEMLNKAIKKRVKDLKPLANMIKVTVESEGWRNIIEPFLEAESGQGKSYKIFLSDKDEKQKYMMLGKSQAFFQFLMLIKNLVAVAEIPVEEEEAQS